MFPYCTPGFLFSSRMIWLVLNGGAVYAIGISFSSDFHNGSRSIWSYGCRRGCDFFFGLCFWACPELTLSFTQGHMVKWKSLCWDSWISTSCFFNTSHPSLLAWARSQCEQHTSIEALVCFCVPATHCNQIDWVQEGLTPFCYSSDILMIQKVIIKWIITARGVFLR